MTTDTDPNAFELHRFFPYLVRDFYAQVTSAVQSAYRQDYDMSPAEWRCMAILGADQTMTANEIVVKSSMDKVTVSRAVKRMQDRDWIVVSSNADDGRSKLLSLTKAGIETYREIVPKVLEIERKLLADISETQKQSFYEVIRTVKANKARHNL